MDFSQSHDRDVEDAFNSPSAFHIAHPWFITHSKSLGHTNIADGQTQPPASKKEKMGP